MSAALNLLDAWLGGVRNAEKIKAGGNCGVGAGGFQAGNTCAAGGGTHQPLATPAGPTYPPAALKAAQAQARAKFATCPVPPAAVVKENNRKMDEVGAAAFEANERGNSTTRASSRARLLKEFGDGTHCPCVYCGLKLDDSSVTRDKMYTARQGGKYRHDNLVPACLSCNKSRSDKPFAEVKWTGTK